MRIFQVCVCVCVRVCVSLRTWVCGCVVERENLTSIEFGLQWWYQH
jgi:hypothetical protein